MPADELLLWAWTGIADQQPGALDQPVAPVVPITAYEHGALGATAIVAALLARQRTGLGRGITVSGLHAVAALNVSTMVDLPGILRPFAGEKSTTWGPPNYRVYRCGDDTWLYLAALTAPFFIAALDAMDMMDVMLMPGVDGEFLNVFLADIKPVVGSPAGEPVHGEERSGVARPPQCGAGPQRPRAVKGGVGRERDGVGRRDARRDVPTRRSAPWCSPDQPSSSVHHQLGWHGSRTAKRSSTPGMSGSTEPDVDRGRGHSNRPRTSARRSSACWT